ncbi:MAG: phenylalanine--tRNA ligase subunit beta [Deltaproteobacteria bacterium]|nr:phenylalanine--tRNA ligase subunit beta [Deltaproteobacteria bacterium]
MKISLNWLRELALLPPEVDAEQAASALTAQGLEVEGIEPKGRDLCGVVVAEVLAMRPHPSADKLRLVRVRAGDREEDVVCGAPNVPEPGHRVCWAPPGARLAGGRTLAAREVRGVMSPGMLCSEIEMGFSDAAEGILVLGMDAVPGDDVAKVVGAVDDVFEVNVTPNRPDALSHIGIARELVAHFGGKVRWPSIDKVAVVEAVPPMDVEIVDGQGCPRYTARFITGLTAGPSPVKMRLRLGYCGMRPISSIVDATNYVMLETGHPLHAFDLDKLCGRILVRRAKPDEEMETLDGQRRRLAAEDVLITDERGPVAVGGVMGGAQSEVSATTRNVLLEAATFDPPSIRRTAKRLGIPSEASYRYERGVDANGIPFASLRAASLMAKLGGGSLVHAHVDRFPRPPATVRVGLSLARLRRVSGSDYTLDFAQKQLGRLGLACAPAADGLEVTVPSYRPDLSIPEDLVEEILRLGEYGKPARKQRIASNATETANPEGPADRARLLLASAGLSEIVTWAFVPRTALAAISNDGQDAALGCGIALRNPISADYEVMRTSLLPGLADALQRNLSRGVSDAWLFEVGPVVRRAVDGTPVESNHAAGIMAGRRADWLKPGEALDFYDCKRAVEELLRGFGLADAVFVSPGAAPYMHPGISAEINSTTGQKLGRLGELHPAIARRLGIETRASYFEVEIAALASAAPPLRITAPPRFPAIVRDVSFWIDLGVEAAAQRAAFLSAKEPLLSELAVLEDFRDPKYVPAGKKGLLWSMTYRAADRTLTDGEADRAHQGVVAALASAFSIRIR